MPNPPGAVPKVFRAESLSCRIKFSTLCRVFLSPLHPCRRNGTHFHQLYGFFVHLCFCNLLIISEYHCET